MDNLTSTDITQKKIHMLRRGEITHKLNHDLRDTLSYNDVISDVRTTHLRVLTRLRMVCLHNYRTLYCREYTNCSATFGSNG